MHRSACSVGHPSDSSCIGTAANLDAATTSTTTTLSTAHATSGTVPGRLGWPGAVPLDWRNGSGPGRVLGALELAAKPVPLATTPVLICILCGRRSRGAAASALHDTGSDLPQPLCEPRPGRSLSPARRTAGVVQLGADASALQDTGSVLPRPLWSLTRAGQARLITGEAHGWRSWGGPWRSQPFSHRAHSGRVARRPIRVAKRRPRPVGRRIAPGRIAPGRSGNWPGSRLFTCDLTLKIKIIKVSFVIIYKSVRWIWICFFTRDRKKNYLRIII